MFVRIAPDIIKLEKTYWYKLTQATKNSTQIVVGSIVRVNINGRKTKGWVCELTSDLRQGQGGDSNSIDLSKIKEVIEYVSDGPPPHVVNLSEELSKYYLVSPVTFLRAGSPDRIVRNLSHASFQPGKESSLNLILVDPRADRRKSIESCLAQDGSTLLISPDSQSKLAMWIENLGRKVVQYGLNSIVHPEVYSKAAQSNSVIIGGRKTLFAPSSDCKSIIILDDSYEQLREERTPQWSAIDVAIQMGRLWGIDLTVISSIPSSATKDFEITDCRSAENTWPDIFIDDKSTADPVLGAFSNEIVKSIHQSIDLKHDCAIILNNKSAASLLSCLTCNSIAVCENCGHNVRQESDAHEIFHCMNCGNNRAKVCDHCKGTAFKKLRKGIPSIVKECKKMFPRIRVEEFKKGSTLDGGRTTSESPTLYVGTEAFLHSNISIGRLACIVFIDFDTILFRNSLEAFNQSLVIVNRAQRLLVHSEVLKPLIISTRVPNNLIVQDLSRNDFVSNTKRDLELRKELKFAPYYASIKINGNKDPIAALANLIDAQYGVGLQTEGETSSLMLRANSHKELSESCGPQIRSFIAKNRCSLSVDNYD